MRVYVKFHEAKRLAHLERDKAETGLCCKSEFCCPLTPDMSLMVDFNACLRVPGSPLPSPPWKLSFVDPAGSDSSRSVGHREDFRTFNLASKFVALR